MEKIHILTDSSSDIPQALVEQHGIEIVPHAQPRRPHLPAKYYDITPAECCRLLGESDEIRTAMATPAVFLESYNRAFERGCTTHRRYHQRQRLGTYQAACLAKGMFEEEHGEGAMVIEVFDSRTYTSIYGHIVVKAAEMRAGRKLLRRSRASSAAG